MVSDPEGGSMVLESVHFRCLRGNAGKLDGSQREAFRRTDLWYKEGGESKVRSESQLTS